MCSTAVCACSSGCPRSIGVANTLGFAGGAPACCRAPCPTFPIHHVVICVQVNNATTVTIEEGCRTLDSDPDGCGEISYGFASNDNSWGRKCRVVEFNRKVSSDRFLRVRFCSNSNSCAPCGEDVSLTGGVIPNKLIRFQVDGVNYKNTLQLVLERNEAVHDTNPCLYVGCIGGLYGRERFSDCCTVDATTGDTFLTLNDIPRGSEIRFGPIGDNLL